MRLERADVDQLAREEAVRRHLTHREQPVDDLLIVVREIRVEPVADCRALEAHFDLLRALRTERRVADRIRAERRLTAPAHGVVRTERVERAGRATGFTERRA